MATFKMKCGCLSERHREALVKMCAECQTEFNVRHAASVAERAEARKALQEAA